MTAKRFGRLVAIVVAAASAFPAVAAGQATSLAPVRSQEHAGHQAPQEGKHAPGERLPAGLPPITDEDRKAAFPVLDGHSPHDEALFTYVLFDRIEWQAGDRVTALSWDTKGWVGGDLNRFWFRTEGEVDDGALGQAEAHLLYGRAFARWWDVVVGVRQDLRPGPARTWAAVGIQGLAPYRFEVEATAYLGESGRTHLRVETEYELLLTNRVVLQPLVEVQVHGKADPERGIGAGLGSVDAGLRLRYEIRRELAPYVGVTWTRRFFATADLAEAAGEDTGGARLAIGVRLWF